MAALEAHANAITGDCDYVQIGCKWNCGSMVRRKDLEEHQTNTCSARPWYVGIKDASVRRLAEKVERMGEEKAELRHHLGELQGKVLVLENEKDALRQDLIAARTQLEQISEIKVTVEEVKRENAKLRTEIDELKFNPPVSVETLPLTTDDVTSLVQALGQDLNGKMETLSMQISEVSRREAKSALRLEAFQQGFGIFESKQKLQDLDEFARSEPSESPVEHVNGDLLVSTASPLMSDTSSPVPFDFTVDHCKRRRKTSADYYSMPLISHEKGYKLCARVSLSGMGSGRGTHVSLYVYLMRGENDDKLSWPFRGNVQIHLLNQIAEAGNHEQVIDFSQLTPTVVADRVTIGERASRGQGYAQFVSYLDLKLDTLRNRQFLKNDELKFRVVAVELASDAGTTATKQKSVLKRLFK